MLERIQYALFILLFVLAGSLDGAQVQSGRVVSQPDRICQSTLRTPVPAHNCFTAAVFTCDAPIENPVQPSAQKAIVRLRHDARAMASAAAVLPSGLFGLLRPASQAGRLLCLFAGAYPDLAAVPVPVLPHVPG